MPNCTNPALVLNNPNLRPLTQIKLDMAQLMPCHTEKAPVGSLAAVAMKP